MYATHGHGEWRLQYMTAMDVKDRGKETDKLLPRCCVQNHLVRVASSRPPSRGSIGASAGSRALCEFETGQPI
jgi:hypothetical protein